MLMFKLIGRHSYSWRWYWIAVGVVALCFGIFYGVNVINVLKPAVLTDPDSSSSRAEEKLLETFPASRVSIILLANSTAMTVDQPEYKAELLRLIGIVKKDRSHPAVTTFYDTHENSFVSLDRHETFAIIGLSGDQHAAYMRIRDELSKAANGRSVTAGITRIAPNLPSSRQPLSIAFGGPAVADYEMNQQVQSDLPKLGAVSLPLLLILLVLIFRSLIAATLPLLIGAISVLGAFTVTRVLSSHIDICDFAANIIALLGLGLAVDYSLLLVSRFRDELEIRDDVATAIEESVRTAGAAIFLSGTTVAVSLLGLLVFPEMFLRSMGIGGAVAVSSAVAASLTVLPALLAVLGKNVNRLPVPFLWRRATASTEHPPWRRLGRLVVGWPIPVLVSTLGILFWLGLPFLHVRFADPGLNSLPAGFQSRIVGDVLSRDFSNGQASPIEILVTMDSSPVSQREIPFLLDYISKLSHLPGVTAVHGVNSVGSQVPAMAYPAIFSGNPKPEVQRLKTHFLSGNTALITVDYRGNSSDQSTQEIVRRIHAIPIPDASEVLVGGDTAELVDRLQSLGSHLPGALTVTFLLTFILLTAMLRSIVIPVKAILLNVLSLSASFGLMTWIFQDGHLEKLLHFRSCGSLDPTLPVLIFAIAFGLATDYEVFLVSRIREEYLRTGINSEAVVLGVEKTGAIITCAGLLLVIVVAAFGLGEILSMKEMGVGLAIAVTVDTAVVRTLLVPAAMQLFGRLNWWMPDQGWLTNGIAQPDLAVG